MARTRARLIVEIGLGIDLIGEDVNLSVKRGINDVIHRVCIPYFTETGIDPHTAEIIVDIYTPYPDKVRDEIVAETLPVKPAELLVRKHQGGALIEGLGKIIVSVVSITIKIPTDLSSK